MSFCIIPAGRKRENSATLPVLQGKIGHVQVVGVPFPTGILVERLLGAGEQGISVLSPLQAVGIPVRRFAGGLSQGFLYVVRAVPHIHAQAGGKGHLLLAHILQGCHLIGGLGSIIGNQAVLRSPIVRFPAHFFQDLLPVHVHGDGFAVFKGSPQALKLLAGCLAAAVLASGKGQEHEKPQGANDFFQDEFLLFCKASYPKYTKKAALLQPG